MSAKSAVAHEAKKRILMLHGWSQNGGVFALRTKVLAKKLRRQYDVVYVDAPFTFTLPDKEDPRGWWYYTDEDRSEFEKDYWRMKHTPYRGWEQSLQLITDTWAKQGPFDAILGFSQGAQTANVVAHTHFHLAEKSPFSSLKAVILVSGFALPAPSHLDFYPADVLMEMLASSSYSSTSAASAADESSSSLSSSSSSSSSSESKQPPSSSSFTPLPLPSLHIMGEGDQHVPISANRLLSRLYADPTLFVHSGTHCVPQKSADVERVLQFLQSVFQD